MTCAACIERETKKPWRDWAASAPRCAFPDGGPFQPNNWNCATANMIREVCGDYYNQHPAVDWRAFNRHWDNGDEKYATIEVPELEEIRNGDDDDGWAMALWVQWSKRRGRTNQMWLLFSETPARPPTEQECLLILENLRKWDSVTAKSLKTARR